MSISSQEKSMRSHMGDISKINQDASLLLCIFFWGFLMSPNVLCPTRDVQRLYHNDECVKGLSPSSIYMRGKGVQQQKIGLNPYTQYIFNK